MASPRNKKYDHTKLCPANIVQTTVPFPIRVADEKSSQLVDRPDEKETISVEITSELIQYQTSGSIFGTNGNESLRLVHDANGQPMVVSIGSDKKLYVLIFVNGAQGRWQQFNISPTGEFGLVALDAMVIGTERKKLVIAVAEETSPPHSTLYHATIDLPSIRASADGSLQGFDTSNIKWKKIENILGETKQPISKIVSGIRCMPAVSNSDADTMSPDLALFRLVVSTDATTTHEASHYHVDPTVNCEIPWTNVMLPKSGERVLGCQPAVPNNKDETTGSFILLEHEGNRHSCVMRMEDTSSDVLIGDIGVPQSICSSINRRGYTDLLISTSAGIAFYDHRNLQTAHTILLPDVSFQSAVCSEQRSASDPRMSKLAIFGLSTAGELYFIEGTRTDGAGGVGNGKILTFLFSSVPIRSAIRSMDAALNPNTNNSELLYVLQGSDDVRHLCRDNETSLWLENKLTITASPGSGVVKPSALKYSAFLTTISMSDRRGNTVPMGYPVQLSTGDAPVHAMVNGRAYLINTRAQTVPANEYGQVDVVIPANGISGTRLSLGFTKFLASENPLYTVPVETAQRVLDKLGSIQSTQDLRDAKLPNGKSLLVNSKLSETEVDEVAKTMGAIPKTVQHLETITKADEILENTGNFLGDALEFVKKMVKKAVSFVVKIAGKALVFVLKIAAKVYRFVINTVGAALDCIGSFLENVLGIDLSSIRAWFAYRFQRAQKNQKALARIITSGIESGNRLMAANRTALVEKFDDLAEGLEQYVGKPTPKVGDNDSEDSGPSSLQKFLSHPLVKVLLNCNPLSWIMEGVQEGFSESGLDETVKIPKIPGVSTAKELLAFVSERFGALFQLVAQITDQISLVINDPTKAKEAIMKSMRALVWSAFDSVKALVVKLYDMLASFIKDMGEFITGEWKLPPFTDIWEDITGIPFTLVNLFTYLPSIVMALTGSGDTMFDDKKVDRLCNPSNIPEEHLWRFWGAEKPVGLVANSGPLLTARVPSKLWNDDIEANMVNTQGSDNANSPTEKSLHLTTLTHSLSDPQRANALFEDSTPLITTATVQSSTLNIANTTTVRPKGSSNSATMKKPDKVLKIALRTIDGLARAGALCAQLTIAKSAAGRHARETALDKKVMHGQPGVHHLDGGAGELVDAGDPLFTADYIQRLKEQVAMENGDAKVGKEMSMTCLAMGLNMLAFCAKMGAAMVIHDAYPSDGPEDVAGRQNENYDGLMWSAIGGGFSMILPLIFGKEPFYEVAIANTLTNVSHAMAMGFAPGERRPADWIDIGGSAMGVASALSSLLPKERDPSGTMVAINIGSTVLAAAAPVGYAITAAIMD